MYLNQEYRDMIEIFNEQGVKYLVVGAYAMSTFGYSRSTYDIDLWIEKQKGNVQKVLMAFEEFGLPFEISEEDLTKNNSIIQIGVAPIRIDILTDIDGVNFDEAYKKKIEHNFGELVASVINIDDIIKNKTASNRAKDKIDIIELKKLEKSLK
jgi:hypothetical protein